MEVSTTNGFATVLGYLKPQYNPTYTRQTPHTEGVVQDSDPFKTTGDIHMELDEDLRYADSRVQVQQRAI